MPLKTSFVNYSTGQATSKQHKVAQTDPTGKSCGVKLQIGDVMEKNTERLRILNSPKALHLPCGRNQENKRENKNCYWVMQPCCKSCNIHRVTGKIPVPSPSQCLQLLKMVFPLSFLLICFVLRHDLIYSRLALNHLN